MRIPDYHFPTDLASILARLEGIDPIRYGRDRNYLTGSVTYLSPYISRGFLTVADIRDRMLMRWLHPQQIEQFLKELAWREYFLRVWESIGTQKLMTDIRFEQSWVRSRTMPKAFLDAKTGIEALDLGIQKLYETGYMHNHIRMYIAGIACNLSGAYWQAPARWMYYHLLDGDIASNTCSWQWNAGAFSSKKYITVQENVNQYTGSTQRKTFLDCDYDAVWDTAMPAHMLDFVSLSLTTKLPPKRDIALDPRKPLAIYTNYWLNPQWLADRDMNRVLVLSPSHFKEFPVSEKVLTFISDLATKNITGIQIFVGEISELVTSYRAISVHDAYLIDHILYRDITGVIKTPYPYMASTVSGYFQSFFNYWKQAESTIMLR